MFVAVRGRDGYGDAGLHRAGGGWIEWLHVSKYPPSLTFLCLELAVALAALALLLRLRRPPRTLVVLGQSAMCFYLLHVHLLKLPAFALDLHRRLGLGATYAATGAALLVLYPVCRAYGRLKRRHRRSLLRLL